MKNILAIAVLFVTGAASAQVGFKNGNHLQAVSIDGDITVQCNGTIPPNSGIQTAYFHCEDDILNPVDMDYFRGPAGVKADEVDLTATHEDGSQRSKTAGYDSSKALSTSRFNLWISTLLQRPLLDIGKNQIAYLLKSKGKVIAQGAFEAIVSDGGQKTCARSGFYFSNNPQDCTNGFAQCDLYFRENNYCQ